MQTLENYMILHYADKVLHAGATFIENESIDFSKTNFTDEDFLNLIMNRCFPILKERLGV